MKPCRGKYKAVGYRITVLPITKCLDCKENFEEYEEQKYIETKIFDFEKFKKSKIKVRKVRFIYED